MPTSSRRWPTWTRLTALALLASLSGCGGSGDGSDTANATPTSVAVQTVGADLLPPDADIAGVDPASLSLGDEELSPEQATATSVDGLLPPS